MRFGYLVSGLARLMASVPSFSFGEVEVPRYLAGAKSTNGRSKTKMTPARDARAATKRKAVKRARRLGHA